MDKHRWYNPNCIVGSGAEVERLRSIAGLIMNEKRNNMTPMNFEALLFLKLGFVNRSRSSQVSAGTRIL
jgi:hypothetical protein